MGSGIEVKTEGQEILGSTSAVLHLKQFEVTLLRELTVSKTSLFPFTVLQLARVLGKMLKDRQVRDFFLFLASRWSVEREDMVLYTC